jgi:hypothetical protein
MIQSLCTPPASDYRLQGQQKGLWGHRKWSRKGHNFLKGEKGLANIGGKQCLQLTKENSLQKISTDIMKNRPLGMQQRKRGLNRERENHYLWIATAHPKHGTWQTPITCGKTTVIFAPQSNTSTQRQRDRENNETKRKSLHGHLLEQTRRDPIPERVAQNCWARESRVFQERLRDSAKPNPTRIYRPQ